MAKVKRNIRDRRLQQKLARQLSQAEQLANAEDPAEEEARVESIKESVMGMRGDNVLIRRAVREGWPIPTDQKVQIVIRMLADVTDPGATKRERASASRVLATMARANADLLMAGLLGSEASESIDLRIEKVLADEDFQEMARKREDFEKAFAEAIRKDELAAEQTDTDYVEIPPRAAGNGDDKPEM
jgi:hypothetical protein